VVLAGAARAAAAAGAAEEEEGSFEDAEGQGVSTSEQDRSAGSNALILRLCLSGMLEEDEEAVGASTGWMLGPAASLMPCSAIGEGGARGMGWEATGIGAGAELAVSVAGADEADGRLERAFLPGV
jgi:hypothetical protein